MVVASGVKGIIFVLLLLASAAGAQSCQMLEEAGASSTPDEPNLKELTLGALADFLASRNLLGDDEPASFALEGETSDPASRVAAACFGDLLFIIKELETLVVYNLIEERKVSEVDVLGLPAEVSPVTEDVVAVTLLLFGRGTSAAVIDLETGRVLFDAESGGFSNSSVGLTLTNRVLIESDSWGQGTSSVGLIVYEVEENAVQELSACGIDAPPADDYAVSSRGIYALSEASEGYEGRLLSGCQSVSAALLER